MSAVQTAMSRDDTVAAITKLLSRFAAPHAALEVYPLRALVHENSRVLVDTNVKGDPALVVFGFFVSAENARMARFTWNLDTFNVNPKIYILNALQGFAKGMGEAAEHDLIEAAERFA